MLSVWAWYHRKKLCANVTCGLNRLLHILGHWCECIFKVCVIEEIKERDSEEQWLQSLCFGYQHFGLQVRIHLKDITEMYRKFYLQMLLHNMQTGMFVSSVLEQMRTKLFVFFCFLCKLSYIWKISTLICNSNAGVSLSYLQEHREQRVFRS